MRAEEAIEIIKQNFPKTCRMVNGRYQGGFDDTECDFGKALLMAIEAIKEIQKYQLIENATIGEIAEVLREFSKIGTVEECRGAVEKQKAKKAIIQTTMTNGRDLHDRPCSRQVHIYLCPTCDTCLGYVGECSDKHCPECGQAIQWNESLEGME